MASTIPSVEMINGGSLALMKLAVWPLSPWAVSELLCLPPREEQTPVSAEHQ